LLPFALAVLAACLYWIEAQQQEVSNEQLAALFSRIRFPNIPGSTLLNYHCVFPALKRFDPDQQLLKMAVRWHPQ